MAVAANATTLKQLICKKQVSLHHLGTIVSVPPTALCDFLFNSNFEGDLRSDDEDGDYDDDDDEEDDELTDDEDGK